jgi:hypothetical protein
MSCEGMMMTTKGKAEEERMDVETEVKGKAVPLQAWSVPEGSRKLSFPDFMTTAQGGDKSCQPYAPAAFTPIIFSWYSVRSEGLCQ